VTWSEIRAYFHVADVDGDGVVDIDEFLRFLEEEE
jgi:Ca2+-binding EF-hand superfamily protein